MASKSPRSWGALTKDLTKIKGECTASHPRPNTTGPRSPVGGAA